MTDPISLTQLRERATDRIFGLPEAHQMLLVDRHELLALITVAETARGLTDSAPGRLELAPDADFDADTYSSDLAKLSDALARFTE